MSDAPNAPAQPDRSPRITELNVSGHLMTLDTGVFCIVQTPSKGADLASGMPGVRVSIPPGPVSRPDVVEIAGFNADGWMSGFGDAALVRVSQGPAQVLVTVYQSVGAADQAPNLQVLRLLDRAPPGRAVAAVAAPAAAPEAVAAPAQPAVVDMVAHIQGRGDVGVVLGEWLGEPGSKRWIEGFAIAPAYGIAAQDIEYQAVLGRGWLSPWAEGGQFCGSRGMALPVLGLKLRLRGKAAEELECEYSGSFVDGTEVGPVPAGEACEAESLAPLEAFRVVVRRRDGKRLVAPPPPVVEVPVAVMPWSPAVLKPVEVAQAKKPAAARKPAARTAAKPVAKPVAKPAAKPAARPVSRAAVKPPAKPAPAAKRKPAPKRGR
jgi:hypothetical protein